jgi:manganese/zinc/iron transport system substrate-binding protein
MKMLRITAVILSLLLLVGCQKEGSAESSKAGKLYVVSTIGMIGDAVKEIGGPHVESVSLMGPGVDPHLYRGTASDVSKLEKADLILYGGLELEGRMSEILERLNGRKPTTAVSKDISADKLLQSAKAGSSHDPHIWFDVELWRQACQTVGEALVAADPDHAADYKARLGEYLAKLEALDAEITKELHSVPESQRVLVTAHDAFQYFGHKYGYEVKGIQGTSTATEAGAADIKALANDIAQRKIKAIFVESSVPKNTIEALQQAVKSRGWTVQIGGQLFSDAMGDAGTPEGTYVGMVRHNVKTIVEALK